MFTKLKSKYIILGKKNTLRPHYTLLMTLQTNKILILINNFFIHLFINFKTLHYKII